jgi:hypothetical protein
MIESATVISPVLQLAISPVILISAAGLLLLTLNNRLAHSIDRARALNSEKESSMDEDRNRLQLQIDVIYSRARLLQRAVTCIIVSVIAASALIISLFCSTLMTVDAIVLDSLLFIGSLLSLMLGLVFFLIEVYRGLEALRTELDQ